MISKVNNDKKDNKTYVPHLGLLVDLKKFVKSIFDIGSEKLNKLSFYDLNNFTDYMLANLFEGFKFKE